MTYVLIALTALFIGAVALWLTAEFELSREVFKNIELKSKNSDLESRLAELLPQPEVVPMGVTKKFERPRVVATDPYTERFLTNDETPAA
jgi:hypothetical protein